MVHSCVPKSLHCGLTHAVSGVPKSLHCGLTHAVSGVPKSLHCGLTHAVSGHNCVHVFIHVFILWSHMLLNHTHHGLTHLDTYTLCP